MARIRREWDRSELDSCAEFLSGDRTCFWCGRAEADGPRWCDPYARHKCPHEHHDPLELDHLVPQHRGGRDVPGNIVLSCRKCNRGRRERTIQHHHGIPDEQVVEWCHVRADHWMVAKGKVVV